MSRALGLMGGGLVTVLAASGCGGHSTRNGDADVAGQGAAGGASAGAAGEGTTVAGTAGASGGVAGASGGVAGASGGVAGASGGVAGASGAVRGCPDASWGRCDAGLSLTVRLAGASTAADGAWAEPLQVPTFSPPATSPPEMTPTAPDAWDRSALPAGACVFRVHGAPADCLGKSGQLTLGACAPGPVPIPLGYYELPNCDQGIAPGCPSDQPYAIGSSIWYAVADARVANEATLVVCAGLCAYVVQVGGLCLRHSPAP